MKLLKIGEEFINIDQIVSIRFRKEYFMHPTEREETITKYFAKIITTNGEINTDIEFKDFIKTYLKQLLVHIYELNTSNPSNPTI